jgi:tetratricopeptide (TPR) repeat protein
MTYREFVYDYAPDRYFARLNDLLASSYVNILRGVRAELSEQRILAVPVPTVRNAIPASGTFPLVMYSPGGGASLPDNGVLAAYLASHGYIVGSLPQLTSVDSRLQRNYQTEVEAHARDIEFAVGALQSLPSLDRRRLAVTGFSRGGLVALRVAARNPNVDAVVGLDPSYAYATSFERVTGSSAIDVYAFRIPVLTLLRDNSAAGAAPWGFVLDSLRYADRYIARVRALEHNDFAEIRSMLYPTLLGKGDLPAPLAEGHLGYTAIARYVLNFLNGTLKGNSDGLEFAARPSAENDMSSGLVQMNVLQGADVPTRGDLVRLVAADGYEEVASRIREAIRLYPDLVVIREDVLISAGTDLHEQQEIDLAAEVFQLALEIYPQSGRAYEGLANIYVARGETDRAVWAYERLLEVLPADSTLSAERKARYRREVVLLLRLLKMTK